MIEFFLLVLASLYFMLPAYIANMSPVFAMGHLSFLAKPVDFGAKLRGKPLLGSHKTFRGVIVASIAGILVFLIQVWLFKFEALKSISLFDYSLLFSSYSILPGFLLGFGAIFGDMVKSLVKRQMGVKAGGPWFPWDQLDFLIGALLFIYPVFVPSLSAVIVLAIMTPLLHISANRIGYYLNIKEVKW